MCELNYRIRIRSFVESTLGLMCSIIYGVDEQGEPISLNLECAERRPAAAVQFTVQPPLLKVPRDGLSLRVPREDHSSHLAQVDSFLLEAGRNGT